MGDTAFFPATRTISPGPLDVFAVSFLLVETPTPGESSGGCQTHRKKGVEAITSIATVHLGHKTAGENEEHVSTQLIPSLAALEQLIVSHWTNSSNLLFCVVA